MLDWWAHVFESSKYPALIKIVKSALSVFQGPLVESSFPHIQCNSDCEMFRRDDPKYGTVDKRLCQNTKPAGATDMARCQCSIMEGRRRSEEHGYQQSSSAAGSKRVALEEEKGARLRHQRL